MVVQLKILRRGHLRRPIEGHRSAEMRIGAVTHYTFRRTAIGLAAGSAANQCFTTSGRSDGRRSVREPASPLHDNDGRP